MKNTQFKTAKNMFNRAAEAGLRRVAAVLGRRARSADFPSATSPQIGNLRSEPSRAPLAAGCAGVLFLLLCGSFTGAWGQAISNPNQIQGIIEWNNPPGPVKTFLNTPVNGMGGGSLFASQFGGVGFSASTLVADDPGFLSAPYTITVQSGVSPGIQYDVTPQMGLLNGHSYLFATAASLGVEPEPAADVLLNFSECAGLVEVQFCDPDGNPVVVNGGNLYASFLSGLTQAQGTFASGTSGRLAVRGGNTFTVLVIITESIGTDPFVDQITIGYSSNYTVTVGCDQIVPLKFIVPPSPLGSGGDAGTLGKIVGKVDMLTEFEHFQPGGNNFTLMAAGGGPFGNYRYDLVEPLGIGGPSSGLFSLMNLLPSDFLGLNKDYEVVGFLTFGLGRRFQLFETPRLDGSIHNPKVTVPSGTTVDLGNTFVMNPGWVVGDIFLCGPDEGISANSHLRHIFRATDPAYDVNLDGIPDNLFYTTFSRVVAYGHNLLGAGATKTANGGVAQADFAGDFVTVGPEKNHFVGDYRLTLGGLNQETTRWSLQGLPLRFYSVATPANRASYIDSYTAVVDPQFHDVEIVPTQTVTINRRYGFSQVTVKFHTTSGTLFSPFVHGNGSFNGLNFEGQTAQYSASVEWGYGTPISLATATPDGQVVLCIPEGTYTFYPSVESVNPDGVSFSHNTLPAISVTVGPCESIDITPGLVLNVNTIPECVAEPELALSGSVSSAANVASITYTLNGNTVTVCDNCGLNPSFNSTITLADCDNTLQITATDVNGLVSSRSKTIHFDGTPPVITGCQDVSTTPDAGANGAVVNYTAPTALDTCDGPVTVNCDHLSGSFFPLGATEVTCSATDECGNVGLCKFTVTVLEAGRVEHCALTQGFYGNPTGKFNRRPSLTLLNSLLTPNSLVVGKLGVRSLTVPASDTATLQARLPAGKAPAVLPTTGDKTLATVGVPLTKNKFDNVLLGQTITLSLNVRLDSSLLSFSLPASFCTQGTLPGPDGLSGTSDDALVTGDFQSFNIPESVRAALSNASLGILNGTVQGLLELANRGLAGQLTGGAKLSDINAAVDAINRGFDGCRVLVDCATHMPIQP